MLDGTARAPGEVIGLIPPNYAECTVEKVAEATLTYVAIDAQYRKRNVPPEFH